METIEWSKRFSERYSTLEEVIKKTTIEGTLSVLTS